MRITEAAMAHLAKLAEQGAEAKPKAKAKAKKAELAPVEEVAVEETPAEAKEAPTEGE